MANVSLNLNSFLKHVNTAGDSDTMVMRGDGKASVRGRIRTAFTSNAKYRETTQKFVNAYCQTYGVDQEFANEFFADNLRQEGAKPLQARTVKSFLAAVNARKMEEAERSAKLAGFTQGSRDHVLFLEGMEKSLRDTALVDRGLYADKRGREVLNVIGMTLESIPEDKRAGSALMEAVKAILNDGRLSVEQGIRRLNLLSNFLDPSQKKSGLKLNYSDPFERAVLHSLYAQTDAKDVNWDTSAERILASTLLPHVPLREGEMKTDFMACMKTMSKGLREAMLDQVASKMVGLSPAENKSPEEQKQVWKSVLANPELDQVLDQAVSWVLGDYRVTSLQAFVKDASILALGWMNTYAPLIADLLPEGYSLDPSVFEGSSQVQNHPELFTVTLSGAKMLESPNPVNTLVGLHSNTQGPSDSLIIHSDGRSDFAKDYNRSYVLADKDLRMDTRKIFTKTGTFALYLEKGKKGYIQCSSRAISAQMKSEAAKNGKQLEELSDAEVAQMWDDAIVAKGPNGGVPWEEDCNQMMDKLDLFKCGTQQVGAALTLLTQNQDFHRKEFLFLGGTVYDRGIIVNEDSSINVVFASKKDSPVHYCRVIKVETNGMISTDEKETYMTTDPTKVTPKLRELQDFFESLQTGFEKRVENFEAAAKEKGESLSEIELYQQAFADMYENPILTQK